ncbi:P-loop containing nucleoside triphosphate hydrolase [Sesbania bispinosa]|nr:P-loop containing nucleoside triphosphate hydrolase [Sesbania bispinosa]
MKQLGWLQLMKKITNTLGSKKLALPYEAADFIKTMSLRLQIAYKIQYVKSRIDEIKERISKSDDGFEVKSSLEQGPSSSRGVTLKNFVEAPTYMDEANPIVGFEAPRAQLIDWLENGKGDRIVISVVGMGGQGKITLVRKIFDSKKMLHKFCKYWNESPPLTTDRGSLIEEVRKYLKEKRILITTRNLDVAKSCMKSSLVKVHQLQPLTLEKSLELFCKTTFRDMNGRCPGELVNISSEIVEKCQELQKNSRLDVMEKLLGFSYDDLPYHLKSCFLYFGMYPKDYEVRSKRLIRDWIAEGFVKDQELGKNTLEDVAEGYLTELISGSLVQVSSICIDGKVKACRVHDLLRELILRKCKDLSFCHYASEDDRSISVLSRRLSIPGTSKDLTRSIESSPIRSLLFFTRRDELPEYLVQRILTKYMLKILDFEGANLKHVPDNLGNLIHLKYLSFKCHTKITSLPKSIGKLHNLETLITVGTNMNKMPNEISKLKKLRHLQANSVSLIELKDNIGGMESLQTLSHADIDEAGVELIRKLGMLKQLRKLSLWDVRKKHASALCSSINEMRHLEKLFIVAYSKIEVIDLHFISSLPMLRRLVLEVKLNKLPEWIPKLENLVKLTLRWSS